MYFNFEDYRPDTPTLPRSLTRLEASLLTIVVYLSLVILMLIWPELPFVRRGRRAAEGAREGAGGAAAAPARERAIRVRGAAGRYPGAASHPTRGAVRPRSKARHDRARAEKPTNTMPFARGNTFERIEGAPPVPETRARRQPLNAGPKADEQRQALPESPTADAVEGGPTVPQSAAARIVGGVLADAIRNVQKYAQQDTFENLQGGGGSGFRAIDPVRHARASSSARGCAGSSRRSSRNWFIPYAAMSHARARGRSRSTSHKDGRITDVAGRAAVDDRRVQQLRRSTRSPRRTRRSRCRPSIPTTRRSSRSRSSTTKTRRPMIRPTRTQQIGLLLAARPRSCALALVACDRGHGRCDAAAGVVAILGPTATGKSALGIALAERFDGEIVNCDSTAVYRGFDIGTDKVPVAERRGIPHHLIDVADPTEEYTAARLRARRGARRSATSTRAGRLPILVGGTGFYYRALTRGLFPGPGARRRAAGAARAASPTRRGVERLHRLLRARRPAVGGAHPAARPQAPGARARGLLPDRPAADRALRRDACRRCRTATSSRSRCRSRRTLTAERVARARRRAVRARAARRGARAARARACPRRAHPFSGLVYRQVLEHLHGVRDEAATRELIVQENRRLRAAAVDLVPQRA